MLGYIFEVLKKVVLPKLNLQHSNIVMMICIQILPIALFQRTLKESEFESKIRIIFPI